METTVQHIPEEHLYEITVSGEKVGYLKYREHRSNIVLYSTQVGKEHRHQGIAGILVRHALDDIRKQGRTMIPSCPYVGKFVQDNPEYQDLVGTLS